MMAAKKHHTEIIFSLKNIHVEINDNKIRKPSNLIFFTSGIRSETMVGNRYSSPVKVK